MAEALRAQQARVMPEARIALAFLPGHFAVREVVHDQRRTADPRRVVLRLELLERGADHGFEHCDHASAQPHRQRSEEHTSELQSLMRISYAVFCLKKKKQ